MRGQSHRCNLKMKLLHLSVLLILLLIRSAAGDEQGCVFSATQGELKCILRNSTDFGPFIPAEERELVRWLTLYVGTSDQLHTDASVPITFPDLSIFEKMSFLRVYIYSDTSSSNYSPDIFASTSGTISVVSLYTLQPVPFDIGMIGGQGNLEKLKILSVSNFNISGVTNANLAGLSGLESLQLTNAEEGQESILMDAVFKLGESLPKLSKLKLQDFQFYPLLTVPSLLTPLDTLQSLILEMSEGTGQHDETVFFDKRIFPVLKDLQLLRFEFSHFESVNPFLSMPPLTKLRLQARSLRSLPLSLISQPEGGAQALEELNLANFNVGNLTSSVLRHLPNIQRLYLSGSEDTVHISDGAFIFNEQLGRLRVTHMPNLVSIAPQAFEGLTKLVYLHLSSLNGLRTLSTNTSSLHHLTSLYLTSNRALEEVPVEFFLPLVSLRVLNVRSSKFDEECLCSHSYLSSLLTFSRPDPQFRLSSSCHDDGEFARCSKSYQGNMCWDFLDKCPHFCIPSGNLSYSCACPQGQGDLETGAACVELSSCGLSSGIVSHYCHSDAFSCVTHYRNQTISCSCYSDHVLVPDRMSCRSLSGCVADGDVFRCEEAGMECDDKQCECVPGTKWDPVSKSCLAPTTTVTTIPTTTPTTTTITTTTAATTTTPIITTAIEETITTTTTTTTTPATTTVTTTATEETTTTTPTTTAPTTTTTPATTTATTTVAATTTAPATTTTAAITTPIEETPPPTTTPTTTMKLTEVTTTTPTVAPTTKQTTTTTTTTTTTLPEQTTNTPTVIVLGSSEQSTTTTTTTEPTNGPSLLPISSNMAYILGLTLGSICVGSIILVLVMLVVVLLAKICVYKRNKGYKVNKPESMRSFESSNTSSPPSAFKELSV